LRDRGFQGLTLTHFCSDRAVFKPLTTRLTARHEAFYQLAPTQCDDSGLSQLTNIVVSTPMLFARRAQQLEMGRSEDAQ
jgi:hypothetical protein